MSDLEYDAVVVGSGATGGVAAMSLCSSGLRTLVLEAGRNVTARDFGGRGGKLLKQLWRHHVSKNQTIQEGNPGYWETNPDFYIDDIKNPYTTPSDKPYRWIRGRQVGGRSHTWGGVALRLSDFEFKAAERDGYGVAWPIGHQDLAPYYSKVERTLSCFGTQENLIQLPDGDFVAEPRLTEGEKTFKSIIEKHYPDRKLIPSRGINARRKPLPGENFSRLSSLQTTLARAEATGNLSLRANSVVYELVFDKDRKRIVKALCIDTVTKETFECRAKVFVLCASTIETVRILMNSRNPDNQKGIGASSGVLGRYLMDHLTCTFSFSVPTMPERYEADEHLTGANSFLIPRYHNIRDAKETPLRGYAFWGAMQRSLFSSSLRKKPTETMGFLCGLAEALPNYDNHMTLSTEVKDDSGIPVPHISCQWTENDLLLASKMKTEAAEMLNLLGANVRDLHDLLNVPFFMKSVFRKFKTELDTPMPGFFVHEVGGARMGTSPQDSVCNKYNQVWEAQNVFIADGACWVTSAWQNPTLTEMAITARACDAAFGLLKRGDL